MGKSSKLRVSQHSGREGSARHNDRSFLAGRSDAWIREHADHIDITKTDTNLILTWDDGQDIEASERAWYAQTYGEAQEATNARYIRERHPERCKTTDQLYEGKQSRPEEMILQIGDMSSGIDPEAFRQTAEDYLQRLYESCGEHMHLLSIAFHYDEASPHAHVRRVWDYTDKNGLTRPGQDKALEAMGVSLPDPSKPKGRYNNRKMTFDKAARELWQEVCRDHGFDIETEPRPDRRHKDKADFIRDQMAREIDKAAQHTKEATQRAIEAQQQAAQATREAQDVQERMKQLKDGLHNLDLYRELESAPKCDDLERIKAASKKQLFGSGVVVPTQQDFDLLMKYAEAAASEISATRSKDKELKQAQQQAQAAQLKAQRDVMSHTTRVMQQYADKDRQLSRYQRMENTFPDIFKQMEDQLRDRHRDRGRGR